MPVPVLRTPDRYLRYMLAVSGLYKTLLVLHLLAVILGFGPAMMAGLYGAEAKKRRGREGLAISEATMTVVGTFAEKFIYAVPILGILLIFASDDAWKFSQAWVSASLAIYIAAIAIVHAVHFPNLKRMNVLMTELVSGAPPPGAAAGAGGPPPQVAELEARGKKAGMVGGLLSLMVVVVVILMVFKPGV